jgi:hypothetical protein
MPSISVTELDRAEEEAVETECVPGEVDVFMSESNKNMGSVTEGVRCVRGDGVGNSGFQLDTLSVTGPVEAP